MPTTLEQRRPANGRQGSNQLAPIASGEHDRRGIMHLTPEEIAGLKTLIPASIACRYKILPLRRGIGKLQIGMAQPENIAGLDEIRWVLGVDIQATKLSEKEIDEGLKKFYGLGAEAVDEILSHHDDSAFIDLSAPLSDLDQPEEEASIVKFVNALFVQAFRDRATDIHIEPFENSLRIRYRIDGLLYEVSVPAALQRLKSAIVSRIKIMANLNIAEQRMPQDGRVKVRSGQRELDLRISILPTPHGESVNLRILNSGQVTLGLENLGLLPRDRRIIERLIQKPHGIILVTGPTGSGKTTTLYSCLNRLNETERKIITIEDPIEYQLSGITQIQIHPKIGLTFAQGLRSMLRHDPDVMLVGEIRDHETAEVTIQVAMTGHLVFSTLHTNDAPSAITRLIDMGIKPFLVASAIQAIMAQRLIRVICSECKVEDPNPNKRILRLLGFTEEELRGRTIYKGAGCKRCGGTGYRGRVGIFEMLEMNAAMRELAFNQATTMQLRATARASGMRTLLEDGKLKILNGVTTPEDLLRVTQAEGVTEELEEAVES